MHRSPIRIAAGLIALAVALTLCGCRNLTWYQTSGGNSSQFTFYADGSQVNTCSEPFVPDESGCAPVLTTDPCVNFPPRCGLDPNTTYVGCVLCSDPIIAEWPDTWRNVSGSWFSGPPFPGESGVVLIEPASNFTLPAGVGPIVTDPGYSAYVVRLNLDSLPQATYQIAFRYNSGGLNSACVKGVEVAMMTLTPGNLRSIAPLGGASLDFTALHAPDPHVFCVGSPVPTWPSTWGALKAFYR